MTTGEINGKLKKMLHNPKKAAEIAKRLANSLKCSVRDVISRFVQYSDEHKKSWAEDLMSVAHDVIKRLKSYVETHKSPAPDCGYGTA